MKRTNDVGIPGVVGGKFAGWLVSAALVMAAADQSAAHPLRRPEPLFMVPASEVLPPELLRGPHHRVDERVLNDGLLNIYTLHTEYGPLRVVSTPSLRKRIDEMNAVAAMELVHPPEHVKAGIVEVAVGVFNGIRALVADPQNTLQGAGRGVAHLVGLGGEHLRSEPSDAEGSALAGLAGLAGCKRDVAREFGVDVYSANPILQLHLDRIARVRYGGRIGVTAAKVMIPGGAGLAVGVTGGAHFLNDVASTASPLTLRKWNRAILERMDVDLGVIDPFLSNSSFSPREQTWLVAGLAALEGAAGKETFLRAATATRDPELTGLVARLAWLYADYHRDRARLRRFWSLGPHLVAETDDAVVHMAPADLLALDPDAARTFREIRAHAIRRAGDKRLELWVPGKVEPRSRRLLEAGGWTVFERCESWLAMAAASSRPRHSPDDPARR